MSHIAAELKRATFPVEEMSHFMYGSKELYEMTKKLEAKFDAEPMFQNTEEDHFLPRGEQMKKSVQRSLHAYQLIKKHPEFLAVHSPLHGDDKGMNAPVGRVTAQRCGLTDHFGLFVNTILAQCTPEQQKEWLMKAVKLEIIGNYAQTELGHGSNVRGLETIATFDRETDTIVINMPKETSMKWWPGALGILSTHAVVYAQLFVDGKNHGFNAFMVQLRDENHEMLPGVEVGDIGPKIGDNVNDAGYLYLKNVRIPRTNMLAKFQQLSRDGVFTKINPSLAKIAYATMMRARVHLTRGAGGKLIQALVIALRYNAFRKQGFLDNKKGIAGGEQVILDYTIQQARMLPALATGYVTLVAASGLMDRMSAFDALVKKAGKDLSKLDASMLPELHAASSGLKAFCTEMALQGMEEARRCCGGHGFALYSGIASIVLDYTCQVTYEGDRHPMALQCARAIMGVLAGKLKKTGQFKHIGPMVGSTTLQRPRDLAHLVKVMESVANRAALDAGKALMAANKKVGGDKAWNACHIQLIRAAHAHVCCYLVRESAHVIATKATAGIKAVLTDMTCLFGLTKLSEMPVVITHLGPKEAKLVDKAIHELLGAIRPNVIGLTEAFGWSDRTLHSRIALKSDDIYKEIYDYAKKCPLNKPEFVESVRKDILSPYLNKKYLAAGNKSRL